MQCRMGSHALPVEQVTGRLARPATSSSLNIIVGGGTTVEPEKPLEEGHLDISPPLDVRR